MKGAWKKEEMRGGKSLSGDGLNCVRTGSRKHNILGQKHAKGDRASVKTPMGEGGSETKMGGETMNPKRG